MHQAQRRARRRALLAAPALLLGTVVPTVLASGSADATASSGSTNSTSGIVSRGTTTLTSGTPVGSAGRLGRIEAETGADGPGRSLSGRGVKPDGVTQTVRVSSTTPGKVLGFQGLNLYKQERYAGFDLEPPDQALCVGGGHTLESVNSVLQVFDSSTGKAQTRPIAINDFYKEPANVAFVTDPVCYFDQGTQRFYHVILTLDTDAQTGEFLGTNHLDIAVSSSSDPAKPWHLYSLDVTKDGRGTYNIGDYPQIGADRNGFYITTNSYLFFADGFSRAFVYAFSKQGLAFGTDTRVTRVGGITIQHRPGFTLKATTSPAKQWADSHRGTEYFLSSQATEEANNKYGYAKRINMWALTNTRSLQPGGDRAVYLHKDAAIVHRYGVPPLSNQKPGPTPLRTLLNTQLGQHEDLGQLDSSDSRMHQTVFANGLVYGALDTVVSVNGRARAGIAYYALRPSFDSDGHLTATVAHQGTLGLAGNNLLYPAFGVLADGRAVMALNVVGRDYHPSAAYLLFRPDGSTDRVVHLTAAGVGPQDGFTEYDYFYGGPARPRWGDYAATAVEGNSIWTASEYIGQVCRYTEYKVDNTCGGTRTTYGNWATYVSKVTP